MSYNDTFIVELPDNEYDDIPEGDYDLQITAWSDDMPNKKGTGSHQLVTFDVINGQHQGRKVFYNLNLKHADEQTRNIAKGQRGIIAVRAGFKKGEEISPRLLIGKILKTHISYKDGNQKLKFLKTNTASTTTQTTEFDAGVYHPTEASTPPPQTDEDVPF